MPDVPDLRVQPFPERWAGAVTEVRLNEEEIAAMEALAAEHGLAAMLDHLGLDGLGNTVNLLSEIAQEASEQRDDNGINRCRICDASWPDTDRHDDWCPIPKLGKAEAWKV